MKHKELIRAWHRLTIEGDPEDGGYYAPHYGRPGERGGSLPRGAGGGGGKDDTGKGKKSKFIKSGGSFQGPENTWTIAKVLDRTRKFSVDPENNYGQAILTKRADGTYHLSADISGLVKGEKIAAKFVNGKRVAPKLGDEPYKDSGSPFVGIVRRK